MRMTTSFYVGRRHRPARTGQKSGTQLSQGPESTQRRHRDTPIGRNRDHFVRK